MTEPQPAPWATAEDVTTLTGASVTEIELARARSVIELVVGRAEAGSNPTSKVRLKLRQAVAYQAAWMKDQPDLFSRMDLEQLSQDGFSAKLRESAQFLAPLARSALRSIVTGSGSTLTTVGMANPYTSGARRYYPASEGVVAVHDYPDDRWQQL